MERFFRNLLLDEQWDLRNRYLHIHPTEEWSVQPNLSTPTSLIHINSQNLIRVVLALGNEQMSAKELMGKVGLKDRENFLEYSLNPAIADGLVRMLFPDFSRHPRQKYLLTERGLTLYKELTEMK